MMAPELEKLPAFARRVERLKPNTIREILKTTEAPDVISFAGGLPAPELFPSAEIAEISKEVLETDGAAALQYGISEGYLPLREWLCAYLARTVGLQCAADRLLITHGSQQGLDLIGKVLLDPGDAVIVEDPSYVGALQAFGLYEADLLPVPIDGDGLRPDALEETLKRCKRAPKFLYTIPNFQNPTGVSASLARRQQIARIAANYGVLIVEDDPYGALRYDGVASPAVTTLNGGFRGIYLGTASKVLAPGMRVAWMAVSDESLFRKLVATKQATDLHTSSLAQRIVARYAELGLLEEHVGKLTRAYRRRRDTMLGAIERSLPSGCDWVGPEGGLFLWLRVPDELDTLALFADAMRRRVAFVPGQAFWVGKDVRNTLRLNFSNMAEQRIIEGIERIGEAVRATLNEAVERESSTLIHR